MSLLSLSTLFLATVLFGSLANSTNSLLSSFLFFMYNFNSDTPSSCSLATAIGECPVCTEYIKLLTIFPIITGSNLITISTLNILTISFQAFSIFLIIVRSCPGIHFIFPSDISLAPNASSIMSSLTINVPPRNVFFNASRFTFDILSQVLFPTTSLYTSSVIVYSPSESILNSPLFI